MHGHKSPEKMDQYIILLIILNVVLGLSFYFFLKIKLEVPRKTISHLSELNSMLKVELAQERQLANEYKGDILTLEKELVQAKSELKHTVQRLRESINNEQKQTERFENIANKVLHKQAHNFNEKQTKGMQDILQPLQEKIKTFEAKIEFSNHESIKRHTSLKEQISFLSKQSQQVSDEANNLAKALKGDFKKQGNWGELILEMILEKSGLEKNREYFIQNSFKDDQGKVQRPDIIIHLPNQKRLIIDSKVSLVDYDMMCSADSKEEAKQHQKNHAIAIRRHIDQLSAKNYHDIYKIESPDFVLMFIPIDTAFSTALSHDGTLYQYGFEKNIIIVSSTTLLATLKTVETLWQHDKQNRYALQIADEAGKMYDKFVGFTEDMDKMGAQINTVQKTYESSMNKLSQGSGNVIRKAQLVKSLGAKANKSLSDALLVDCLD